MVHAGRVATALPLQPRLLRILLPRCTACSSLHAPDDDDAPVDRNEHGTGLDAAAERRRGNARRRRRRRHSCDVGLTVSGEVSDSGNEKKNNSRRRKKRKKEIQSGKRLRQSQ